MNIPFLLFQLQKIDSQISSNEIRLSEISKIMANDPELLSAQKAHQATKNEFESANDALRKQESKIQEKRNKLEQSEASLYGGKIKNPKELQDLQREIISIKSVISLMEDDQLTLMISAEEQETRLKSTDSKLANAKDNNAQKSASLSIESKQIDQENSRLIVERNVLINQIPTPVLIKYDNLRAKKGGVAVAKVDDQTCSLCGASLTPSECQSAKSPASIFTCSSCGRILYADK